MTPCYSPTSHLPLPRAAGDLSSMTLSLGLFPLGIVLSRLFSRETTKNLSIIVGTQAGAARAARRHLHTRTLRPKLPGVCVRVCKPSVRSLKRDVPRLPCVSSTLPFRGGRNEEGETETRRRVGRKEKKNNDSVAQRASLQKKGKYVTRVGGLGFDRGG